MSTGRETFVLAELELGTARLIAWLTRARMTNGFISVRPTRERLPAL